MIDLTKSPMEMMPTNFSFFDDWQMAHALVRHDGHAFFDRLVEVRADDVAVMISLTWL